MPRPQRDSHLPRVSPLKEAVHDGVELGNLYGICSCRIHQTLRDIVLVGIRISLRSSDVPQTELSDGVTPIRGGPTPMAFSFIAAFRSTTGCTICECTHQSFRWWFHCIRRTIRAC